MKRFVLALALVSSAAAAAPSRIFIASDSTAQTYKPEQYPQQGWGAFLGCGLDKEVTVENRAIAARSTRSFINEGRLDKIAADIRPGDTLLIQFGHNDQNKAKPERYASVPDYKTYLRRFIDVARQHGAQAVLITPVTQRKFVGDKVVASFPDYSGAVREVSRETHTPLIDLEQLSGRWVEHAGLEGSKSYYLYYPYGALPGFGAPVADETHFSELGARGIANIVAAALAGLRLPVSRHVLAERPALTRTTPLGSSACEAAPAMLFRFAGSKVAGSTDVAANHAYDGHFGFEPGAPTRFSIALPEGNYRVTATLGGAPSETTILAESRRLMLDRVTTGRNRLTRSFVVNIRQPTLSAPPENAPGIPHVQLKQREIGSYTWDDKLTLTIGGSQTRLLSLKIEPASVPTIYLMGDSTVTDQSLPPYGSWGQMLPAFLGPDAAVANNAESGETLKSFLAEGRLNKVLSQMKPGDYALIQFGHNDQKIAWPQTYAAAASTYRAYLAAYIAEVRLHAGTPILVTPPERGSFDKAGKIVPSLADYAQAMREVAAEQKVPLIDLTAASTRMYETLGPEKTKLLFATPEQERTHHSPAGAYLLARAVAEGLAATKLPVARLLALPPASGAVEVPALDPVIDQLKAQVQ